MEYLNRCLLELRGNSNFTFHPRCKRLTLIHICFTDDLLLYSRGDIESIIQLFSAFNVVSSASVNKASKAKHSIYLGGVPKEVQDAILVELNLVNGDLPFKYSLCILKREKL